MPICELLVDFRQQYKFMNNVCQSNMEQIMQLIYCNHHVYITCNIIKPRYTINKPTQNYYLCLAERCRNDNDQCLHVLCQLSAARHLCHAIFTQHTVQRRAHLNLFYD